MGNLRLIALAVAMLVPVTESQGGLVGALARGAATAGKVERAGAAALSMEKAGAQAANAVRAGTGAERAIGSALGGERSAASVEMNLAREARDFGLKRANDGRFLLDTGRASARLVQGRVGAALAQSPAGVVLRASDGRMMRLSQAPQRGPLALGLVLVADGRQAAGPGSVQPDLAARIAFAAQQAVADVVSTAFREAVFEAQEEVSAAQAAGAKGGLARPGAAQLRAGTRELLRILQDDEVLAKARQVSVAKAAGSRGTTLEDVEEVLMSDKKGQPTALWIRLAPRQNGPREEVWARVNLDQLLALIPMEGL